MHTYQPSRMLAPPAVARNMANEVKSEHHTCRVQLETLTLSHLRWDMAEVCGAGYVFTKDMLARQV